MVITSIHDSITKYCRVHISSNEVFVKILKKLSIVQKEMIPHGTQTDFRWEKNKTNLFLKNTITQKQKNVILQLSPISN